MSKKFILDLAERVGWTAAQAAVSTIAVEVAEWDYTWVPILAAGLAVLKGIIAKKVGDPNSASTVSTLRNTWSRGHAS